MKTSFKGMKLEMIDCGSVTRKTRGLPIGFFYENAPAPFYWTIFD